MRPPKFLRNPAPLDIRPHYYYYSCTRTEKLEKSRRALGGITKAEPHLIGDENQGVQYDALGGRAGGAEICGHGQSENIGKGRKVAKVKSY